MVLALPSVALAAEDRYGPTRRPDPILTAAAPAATAAPRETSGYTGQMLNWSNKAAAPVVQPAGAVMPPASPAPRSQAMASPVPQTGAPNRLPTSLYDGPSAPAPVPAPAPRPAPQAAPLAAWQTAQPSTAQPSTALPSTALPPPPTPQPIAGSPTAMSAYNAPRAYSVVREYGGTPDRIAPPPPQSAFTGREVALDPGLLSEPREEEDRPEDEDDIEQPRKPAAKDRK